MILCAYGCIGMVYVCVLGGGLFWPSLCCVCVCFEWMDGDVCIVWEIVWPGCCSELC